MKIPNHNKYITTYNFIKFSGAILAERLQKAKLSTKADIADFITKTAK